MEEKIFPSGTQKPLVLVTGAAGFIALHCIQHLLENEYPVRCTVRDLNNTNKIKPLREMKGANALEILEADLEDSAIWKSIVEGCEYIMHIASPLPIVATDDIISIAINGTLNVMRAAAESPKVRKLIITSSCSAINDGYKNDECIFNEDCWSDLNSKRLEPYGRSKTMAEKAAWDFWNQLDEKKRYQLIVLNPGFVTGPVLSNQLHFSASIIARMMNVRKFLAIPRVCFGIVDVRDVARAHLLALEKPESDGERILILSTPSIWLSQVAKWLREEFKDKGYSIPRFSVPNWMTNIYLKLNVDRQAKFMAYRMGPILCFDNSKSKRILGLEYTDAKQSVVDMAYSLIEQGIVKEKRKLRELRQRIHHTN